MESEGNNITFSSYLGPDFQLKLIWQILVEPEFGAKIIPKIRIEYFDDPVVQRLMMIIIEYFNVFEKVPNLQNKSIYQAINLYKTPGNAVEEDTLNSVMEKVRLWNLNVLNNPVMYDGDVVRTSANFFIKQQEYRKFAEKILYKTKTGKIGGEDIVREFEDDLKYIDSIGDEEDYGMGLFENIETALTKEFRKPIPTGITVLDELTGGGLGKGEIGIFLSPSGIGKTTVLTKIANTALELGKNVLQIIFEDEIDQVRRKHYTIWSKVPLSEIDDNLEYVKKVVNEKRDLVENKLIVKKFPQENTNMGDIRNFITKMDKKFGIKFDIIVLDYLDCVEPNKKHLDRTEGELSVVKSFLALASDFEVPCWSAVQSNREGFNAEFIDVTHTGGSIKRVQKSHLFVSIAKPLSLKDTELVNLRVIKARFAKDGQTFKDTILNNDTMEIRITEEYNKIKTTKPPIDIDKKFETLTQRAKEMAGLSGERDSGDISIKLHSEISNKLPPSKSFEINDDKLLITIDEDEPFITISELEEFIGPEEKEQVIDFDDFVEEIIDDPEEENVDDIEEVDVIEPNEQNIEHLQEEESAKDIFISEPELVVDLDEIIINPNPVSLMVEPDPDLTTKWASEIDTGPPPEDSGANITNSDGIIKKKRGESKGYKNKPKVLNESISTDNPIELPQISETEEVFIKKKRGRPKGSKNKIP